MPKKKSSPPLKKGESSYENSAVSRLRVITGLSEKEFAKKCGMKATSYKSLIVRQNKNEKGISLISALQISAATGASAIALMDNSDISIFTRKQYTRSDYDHYVSVSSSIKNHWKKELIQGVAVRFSHMLESLLNKDGDDFLPVIIGLASQIDTLAEKHGTSITDSGLHHGPSINSGIAQIAREVKPQNPNGYTLGNSLESDLVELLEHIETSRTVAGQ